MTIKKVAAHSSSAARFLYDDDNNLRGLISYSTHVITIDDNGWLVVSGLYSMTTIKHIGWFMREFNMAYQDAKALYNQHQKYNVYTGEIADL